MKKYEKNIKNIKILYKNSENVQHNYIDILFNIDNIELHTELQKCVIYQS